MLCSPAKIRLIAFFIVTTIGIGRCRAELTVGAAVVDVTPVTLPVYINGSMTAKRAETIHSRVNARAIVVGDGETRIALVVVDSCMMPKVLLDDAKRRAEKRVGISADHIMISATHTHSAPSSFGALGTPADLNYVPYLREKLVEAIESADRQRRPARIGWGSGIAADFTAVRRWILRPDRVADDPFGNPTVRANMHTARNLDDVTGPSGPEDPQLSMIAFESLDGEPIAVLANFSMHYFGDAPISADYFGLFCDGLKDRVQSTPADDRHGGDCVVVMSHGCSGDIWKRDYFSWRDEDEDTIESFTDGLVEIAAKVHGSIEFRDADSVAMAESRLPMRYRVPDDQRLKWSQEIFTALDGELPQTREQIYAREQVLLNELQSTEVVVQAVRLGDIGIVTTPTETYALTGIKFKSRSPLRNTMVIELANGADGYIPPPEQHLLGGYNTWAARSAGLEVTAEPKIVAAGLRLLEQVTGADRRVAIETKDDRTDALLSERPIAFWRLGDLQGPIAMDASGHHRDAFYEPGVVFGLPGRSNPQDRLLSDDVLAMSRSAHFAGGRVRARLPHLSDEFTVLLSFWNGMPTDARGTTGWLFSRDRADGLTRRGIHVGIGGTGDQPGKLVLQNGPTDRRTIGKTPIDRWTWHDLAIIQKDGRVEIYLDDRLEITHTDANGGRPLPGRESFIGGRSDGQDGWEGRIDEVAVFDRAIDLECCRSDVVRSAP